MASEARYTFSEKYGKVESHHLWLLYCSHDYLSNNPFSYLNCEEALSQINAKGFGQLEIEISTLNLQVEKVGVRLVHKQDKEDPNQTMAQRITNRSELNEIRRFLRGDFDEDQLKMIHEICDELSSSPWQYLLDL